MTQGIRHAAVCVIAVFFLAMGISCAGSQPLYSGGGVSTENRTAAPTRQLVTPLALDRASILGIFGKPDIDCSRAVPEMAAQIDYEEINRFMNGSEIFEYFIGDVSTRRFCLGFSNGVLVDAANLDFRARGGRVVSRTEFWDALPDVKEMEKANK